jgi:isorenieratene synthase
MSDGRVIVVGGGIAGLSAATILAERGVPVVLLERERFLGGRAGSWTDQLVDGTQFQMERGFHAFFRQYHNLRALLRRVDPELRSLLPLDDYPLLGPSGAAESFAKLPKRTPFNVMELVRRTKTIGAVDLARVNLGPTSAMLAFDPAKSYARWDRTTARTYLDSLGFPSDARHMLFDVFAHSFFNPEEHYSAGELLAMFHFYFLGNPEGLVFDVMREPFGTAFFEPLAKHLRAHGAEIRNGVEVTRFDRTPKKVSVELSDGERVVGDGVVLALPVPPLKDVIARSSGVPGRLTKEVLTLDTTWPFAVLRLWLDRPPRADRAPFAGTTGLGILDNVSIYEKLETESRAWSDRTGGSVVELHAYAVDPARSETSVREELLEGMWRAYPETREAKILEERLLVRRDCPSFAPGSHATRPRPRTDAAEIVLAGDFVRLPFASALMERAAVSGMIAANALLAERALPQAPILRSGPLRGILASVPRIHRA